MRARLRDHEGAAYSLATVRAKELAVSGAIGLRHTFASNLASDGCNLLIIRDALGHTTTRMSERYAKPSAAALEIMRATLNRRAAAASGTTRGTTQAAND